MGYKWIPTKPKPKPIVTCEPVMPLPETPAPLKSPSASGSPNDEIDCSHNAQDLPNLMLRTECAGLDRSLVEELLTEQTSIPATLEPMSTASVPPARQHVSVTALPDSIMTSQSDSDAANRHASERFVENEMYRKQE